MIVKNFLYYCLMLILIMLTSGCSKSVALSELPGKYICVYPYGREILELNEDGTYIQLIELGKQGNSLNNTGSWRFVAEKNEVIVKNAILLDDNFGKLRPDYAKPVSGIWVMKASVDFGKVVLRWNPDFDYKFTKEYE